MTFSVSSDASAANALGVQPRDGQTAAADSDAVADRDAVETEPGRRDKQLDVAAARCQRTQLADGLNDAGEHDADERSRRGAAA